MCHTYCHSMQTSMSIARKTKTKLAGCTKRLKKCSGKRDKFVFRFGRGSKRVDLVDVVLQIMEEDGPKTWSKKKKRNGADIFYDEHQAEYEARGKQASDPVSQVEQHNSGYPKLRDELAKRRSLTKVTTALNKNIPTRDVSVTKRRRNRTKKTYSRSRNNKNFKRKVNKSHVTKVKSGVKKRTTSRAKYRKMKINKSCQYLSSIEFKTCGTSGDLDLLQVLNIEPAKHRPNSILAPLTLNPTRKSDKDSNCSHLNKKDSELSKDSAKLKSKCSLKEKVSKSEIDESEGETSVTSYNSYLSMDHEPMD